jgi:PAP2 superfamily
MLLFTKTSWFTQTERIRWEWRLMLGGIVTMILGYGSLWNFNYLLARFVSAVHDSSLRTFDEWFYSWFMSTVNYSALFPIVHNAMLLKLLNNAYSILFAELLLGLLLVCQTRDAAKVCHFLKGLFGLYLIGVLCFVIYPAIGPCLYYPESIDSSRVEPRFMAGMLHDYKVAMHGGSLDGYGYFIGFPSLHVMIAMFLQTHFAAYPGLFRLFLPINVILVLSTFLLGYHYILDTVAALVFMGIWIAWKHGRVHNWRDRESKAGITQANPG